jgi:hypothetical protein
MVKAGAAQFKTLTLLLSSAPVAFDWKATNSTRKEHRTNDAKGKSMMVCLLTAMTSSSFGSHLARWRLPPDRSKAIERI